MVGSNIEILTTLERETYMDTLANALVLTVSSVWLFNDNKTKKYDIYNKFKIPVTLGLVYGATKVINGQFSLNKYSRLITESKLTEWSTTFYLGISYDNLVSEKKGKVQPLPIDKFNFTAITDAISSYLDSIKDIISISINLSPASTGSETSVTNNTVNSNIKIDLTFSIKDNKKYNDIVINILKGQINVKSISGLEKKLKISSVVSPICNYTPIPPYPVAF
jgi:hypothetical protein